MKQIIINENLKRVEEGRALTIPLAVLDGEFKKIYKEKKGDFAVGSPSESRMKFHKKECLVCFESFKTLNKNRKVCKSCEVEYVKIKQKNYREKRKQKKIKKEAF